MIYKQVLGLVAGGTTVVSVAKNGKLEVKVIPFAKFEHLMCLIFKANQSESEIGRRYTDENVDFLVPNELKIKVWNKAGEHEVLDVTKAEYKRLQELFMD